MNISVFGLGKLGLPLAACLAQKGFGVMGVDTNPAVVDAVNEGRSPVYEPGLGDVMQAAGDRLRATADPRRAIEETDATFVLVPTPSLSDGTFSLELVKPALAAVGAALKEKDEFHVVTVTSTVLPGDMERELLPLVEQASGNVCGRDFGMCYSPEFVALGSVVRDLLNPDVVLIGESDPRSGDVLESVYQKLCDNSPPISRMNFVNAELSKISVNTFVTAKITFANMIARMCEQLPGADVDTVTSILGRDSRIGSKYLKGAIGYGGPCFPRDNRALSALASALGASSTMAAATDRANREHVGYLKTLVAGRLPPGGTTAILGLSYKPDTDVVEESQGLLLAQELVGAGTKVTVFDPAGMENARRVLGDAVTYADSPEQCVRAADVVVIATPWPDLRSLSPELVARPGAPRIFVDCWRACDGEALAKVADYVPLGVGLEPKSNRT